VTYMVFAYDKDAMDLSRIYSVLEAAIKGNERFAKKPVISFAPDKDEIVLDLKGWDIVLGINSSDYVEKETEELLEHLPAGNNNKRDIIKGSKERLEIVSDDDFDEEHFDDYLLFAEDFAEITGMVLVDPRESAYL